MRLVAMRMILTGYLLICAGCASIDAFPPTVAHNLNSSCVVRFFSNEIELVGSDRTIQLPDPKEWTAAGVTENGRVLSREADLDLRTLAVTPIRPALPGTVIGASADGSKVVLSRREGQTGRDTVTVFDRRNGSSRQLSPDTTYAAISQDGRLVAEQAGTGIRAYRDGKLLVEVVGRLPSWLDAKTLSYLQPNDDYELIDVETGLRRMFKPVGQPIVSLRRSSASGALLYTARTRSDFWSLDLSCPERYRIVVHEREDSPGVVIGYGCKASRPEAIRWIDADAVCSDSKPPNRQ